MTKLGEHRSPEEREREDREIAIDTAGAALADFIYTWHNGKEFELDPLYDDLSEAITSHMNEKHDEAARERQLEEQAEREGRRY